MSKILDELKRIDSEDKVAIKNDKSVKEVTLLLEAPSEDTSLLSDFGIDHQIRINKKALDLTNRQSAIEVLYNAETYTGEQIRELCTKYYLRLLPIAFFRGNIPVELASEIKAFAEKNDIVLTGARYNFFVLADYDQFAEDRHNDNDAIKTASKIKFSPIVFYRENDRDEIAKVDQVFTKVHSWGEEGFSFLRSFYFLFSGAITSDTVPTIVRTVFAITLLLLSLVIGLAGYIYVPVIIIVLASIVIYSNNEFKIASDLLWNRAKESHK